MSNKQKGELATLKAMFKWLLFSILWQGLEVLFYGQPRPSTEDTIIGFILFCYINKSEYLKLGLVE